MHQSGCTQAPVYATLPVAKMGQLLMLSQHAAQRELSDAPPFSGDDVDAACELFRPLRYQQLVTLAGACLLSGPDRRNALISQQHAQQLELMRLSAVHHGSSAMP